MEIHLTPRQAHGSSVMRTASGWRLVIPAGSSRAYRLAQLDDYYGMPRRSLPHTSPWNMSLQARVSAPDIPGTWGFGLWNDPFGFSLGFGAQAARLPSLPQTAWFMHASPPNWLSLQENIPANGYFAGAFHSPKIPSLLLSPALLGLPLSAIRPISRLLRRTISHIIRQDSIGISIDVTQWHNYSISWRNDACTFRADGNEIFSSPVSPRPPLGLVIWIDNQYAAWKPDGSLSYGMLENPDAWLEVEELTVS